MRRSPNLTREVPKSGITPAATAYHEAGHAVVAWRLGIRVRRATIVPDKQNGFAGRVLHQALGRKTRADIENEDRFSPGRLQAEKRVMVSLAGELAQRRFDPRSVRSYQASSDREHVSDILVRYAGVDRDGIFDARAHYKLLRQWTNEMLESHWYLVEAVAASLIKYHTLSGQAVREVILTTMDRNDGLKLFVLEKLQHTKVAPLT